MIRVLFFASLREAAGVDEISIDADAVSNVRELVKVLANQLPAELLKALADESAMVSVDHKYAGWEAELEDGAEVGFLPPVSGG